MQYRTLGKTGRDVSILGFGCMRLPLIGGDSATADAFDASKQINEEEVGRMVRYAVEHGVNYFDTAYGYHGGKSEIVIGRALKPFRDKIMLATKLPVWCVEKTEDFDRLLDEQLQKLDTPFLDFYLVHCLGRVFWDKLKPLGLLKFLDKARGDGRVRGGIGFSFHDDLGVFKEIIDAYAWDICQIQYNYLDEQFQAGRGGMEYAASKGIGVVVMEPLRGGKLTQKIPGEIQAIWDSAPVKRSAADWAFRWLWNQPQVATTLGGMNNLGQLKENIGIAENAQGTLLSAQESDLVRQVAKKYESMMKVYCTTCGYCMPCPNGLDIPWNFSFYNDASMFADDTAPVWLYNNVLAPNQRASNCSECHQCEDKCPQHIAIPEEMKKVHARLGR